MTTKTLHVRATKQRTKDKIRELLRKGLGKAFLSQLAHEYLLITVEAFDKKSEGSSDQFGGTWKPLSQSTIASRSITPRDRKEFRLGTTARTRGLLTTGQDEKWRGIFYHKFKYLSQFMSSEEAKAKAAAYAWNILKSQGARTRLETLGGRKVLIMKDTYTLYDAVQPGTVSGDDYTPPANQKVEHTAQTIKVTIDVPYAGKAMKERPVFPPERAMGIAISRTLEHLTNNFQV